MPTKARILVVGSSNTDLVVFCDRLPKPGETVLGGEFRTFGGGKGANQAVAAARAGGDVVFLGAHGPDTFGTDAKARLQKEGINTDYFECVQSAPSGIALILVDGVTRENLIAVAKSSNDAVDSAMVSAARPAFETASAVISQLEIRDGAIEATARLCQELGKPFILNPAPSRRLPKRIYESLRIIVVNEHEARDISGGIASAHSTVSKPNVESAVTTLAHQEIRDAICALHRMGCKNVVVTLGAEGVMFSEGNEIESIAAPKVQPVDTTGAGDCFVGWLGVGIGEGLSLRESVAKACIAASIAVTRAGAQDGMPYRHEVVSA
jgi:ribokinase